MGEWGLGYVCGGVGGRGVGGRATRTWGAGIGGDLGVSGGGDLERERDLDLGSGRVRVRDRWVCSLVRGLGSG